MTDKPQCCASVPNGGYSVSFHQCMRKGKVERDGKWYCGQHDPESVKARRATRDALWDEQSKQRIAKWQREQAMRAATLPFTTEQLEAGIVGDLVAALREIEDSASPDHWVPEYQHCVDVARSILSRIKTEGDG